MGNTATKGEDDGTAALPLESIDGIDVLRPTGATSLTALVAMVETAIGHARRRGCLRLMVSWDGSSGFDSPSIPTRQAVIRQWAQAADGRLALAMVLPPQFIDHEHFGELVAANFCLAAKAFLTEEAAMAWLGQVEV